MENQQLMTYYEGTLDTNMRQIVPMLERIRRLRDEGAYCPPEHSAMLEMWYMLCVAVNDPPEEWITMLRERIRETARAQ